MVTELIYVVKMLLGKMDTDLGVIKCLIGHSFTPLRELKNEYHDIDEK